MRTPRDKHVIEHWLRLYNRLTGASYRVTAWPDIDSSRENVDAVCIDDRGDLLAVEHTLIEPFQNEKADAAQFLQTLALLENDPALCLPGFTCLASQKVGAVPKGLPWAPVPTALRTELAKALPNLPEGRSTVSVDIGGKALDVWVQKMRTSPDDRGRFLTGRIGPGSPAPELMRNALVRKLPKLSAAQADKRILLLEKDSVAGTIENQYAQVRDETGIRSLRKGIDEIWVVITAGLDSENVIFTNPVDPQEDDNRSFCSLNVVTGEFWQVHR
jgi:hypothetical protein